VLIAYRGVTKNTNKYRRTFFGVCGTLLLTCGDLLAAAGTVMVLLHGVLDVHIKEAQDLPHSLINQAGGLVKKVLCCSAGPQLAGSCDPYLCLDVGKTRRLRSAIITSTTNPKWDERASVYLADEADTLKIEIKVDHSSGHIHEAVSAVGR